MFPERRKPKNLMNHMDIVLARKVLSHPCRIAAAQQIGDRMTRISGLACVMAAVLYLGTGAAIAADNPDAPQVQPAAAEKTETPSKPREETTRTNPTQSTTSQTKEEPECD
jgi:hypothetical protein